MRADPPGARLLFLEWLSIPLLILIWYLIAIIADHRLVPTPWAVATETYWLLTTGKLWSDLLTTLSRVAMAFGTAMVFGSIIGGVLGRFEIADRLFGSWVIIGLNIPAIVVAIACYIWLGLTEFALVLAVVINKAPLVIVTMREGVRALDHDLDELARVYRVRVGRKIRRFLIPQLMPYALSAARTGLSLIWKIVLVFEVLGSDGGIGFRIGIFFQHFNITGILSYTLAFLIVVFAVEFGILRRLEEAYLGWRPAR